MNKPQQKAVEGIVIKNLQVEKFMATLVTIFKESPKPVAVVADRILSGASVIVFNEITGDQLRALSSFSESWNQDFKVIHTSHFLQIDFKLKTNN